MKNDDIRKTLTEEELRKIAQSIKDSLPTGACFLLLTFDTGQGGGTRYVSNGERGDMINVMKEFLLKCGAEEDWMKHI